MERRVKTFQRWYDGYGGIIVQYNVEDGRLGVPEYVVEKLGVEIIEPKWGQGAKDIGGEVKLPTLDRALQLKNRGYIVLPDPEDQVIQEAFVQGDFKEFERHSRLGMVDEEGFHKEVARLKKFGAKHISLKTGAYRPADLARAVKYASDAKIDLLTVDGAGGGTGMSPWRMMNEWGNPLVRLAIHDVGAGRTTWLDPSTVAYEYLTQIEWLDDSQALGVVALNRAQDRADLYRVERNGAAHRVLTETDPAWVNAIDFHFLANSEELVATSQADGHTHLYRYTLGGDRLGAITSGPWSIRGTEARQRSTIATTLDERNGWAYFTARRPDLTQIQLYRVGLVGSGLVRLSSESGGHEVDWSDDRRHYLDALIAETKVHPLWHTALLPTLFLVSCLSMGYGAVVVLVMLLRLAWNAKADARLLDGLSRVNAGLLLLYLALRIGDLAWSGKLALVQLDFFGVLLAAELALFLAPALLLLSPAVRRNRGRMFGAALLAIAAGAAYRVDSYLTVYRPAPGWVYFPSLGELVVTIGMAAIGVALFVVISKLFPVVVIEERAGHGAAREEAARAG